MDCRVLSSLAFGLMSKRWAGWPGPLWAPAVRERAGGRDARDSPPAVREAPPLAPYGLALLVDTREAMGLS
jgi:hypothetical protein